MRACLVDYAYHFTGLTTTAMKMELSLKSLRNNQPNKLLLLKDPHSEKKKPKLMTPRCAERAPSRTEPKALGIVETHHGGREVPCP
jgi:hypothetical protein